MLYKKLIFSSLSSLLCLICVSCGDSKKETESPEDPLRRGMDLDEQTGGNPFASPSLSADGARGLFVSYSTQPSKKGLMGFELPLDTSSSSVSSSLLLSSSQFNSINNNSNAVYSIIRAFLAPDGQTAILSVAKEEFKERPSKQIYAFDWSSKNLILLTNLEEGELDQALFSKNSKAVFLKVTGKAESSTGLTRHYVYTAFIKDPQIKGFLVASQNSQLQAVGLRYQSLNSEDFELVLDKSQEPTGMVSYSFLSADLASASALETKATQHALGQLVPSSLLDADQKLSSGKLLDATVASNNILIHKREQLPLKKPILGNASSVEKALDTEMIKSTLVLFQLDQKTQTSFTDYPGHIIYRLALTQDGQNSFVSAVQSRRCKDAAGLDTARSSSIGLFRFDLALKSFSFIGIASTNSADQKSYSFTKDPCSTQLENLSPIFAVNPDATSDNFRMLISAVSSKAKTPLLLQVKNSQAAVVNIL